MREHRIAHLTHRVNSSHVKPSRRGPVGFDGNLPKILPRFQDKPYLPSMGLIVPGAQREERERSNVYHNKTLSTGSPKAVLPS
jgi:hypothetical protein